MTGSPFIGGPNFEAAQNYLNKQFFKQYSATQNFGTFSPRLE